MEWRPPLFIPDFDPEDLDEQAAVAEYVAVLEAIAEKAEALREDEDEDWAETSTRRSTGGGRRFKNVSRGVRINRIVRTSLNVALHGRRSSFLTSTTGT